MDVYLTREYVEASTLLEPGRPVFLRTDQAVFPAILREGPTDVITPYGYGGPVGPGFWEPYTDWCRANGVVTTFVRFHPLYANQREAGPDVHVQPLAGTVAWRLDEEGDCSSACTGITGASSVRPSPPASRPRRSSLLKAWPASSPSTSGRWSARRPRTSTTSRRSTGARWRRASAVT